MPSFSIRKNIFLIQSIELFQCLDTFLQFTQYEILNNAGKVTAEVAKSFCGKWVWKYLIIQDRLFRSDFDKLIEGIKSEE